MSSYTSFASGGSSPVNQNNSYEPLGFAGTGALTSLAASLSVNTKGSYVSLGTTTNDWAGFWVIVGQGSNAAARHLFDVAIGTTVIAPNIYAEPGTGGNAANAYSVFIPLNVPSGSNLQVRSQSNVGSASFGVAIRGIVDNANSPPLWTTMTALTADTANTRASTVSQGFASSTTWTEQVASTAATYGAMMMIPGRSTTDPVANQDATYLLATGAAAAEVEFWRQTSTSLAASVFYRTNDSQLIQRSIASGSRISASPLVPTPGTMTVCLGLYGFS